MDEVEITFEDDSEMFPIIFHRGDKVNYCRKEQNYAEHPHFKSINNTFVWAIQAHGMVQYVIQHHDGFPKEHFIRDFLEGNFPDGFEAVHSSELKDGLKYIYAYPNELELVEQKTKLPEK